MFYKPFANTEYEDQYGPDVVSVEMLQKNINEINPKPKPKNETQDFPQKCLNLMDKLLNSIISYVYNSSKCKLKKILKKQYEVLKCYLKNAEDPCSFTVYFEEVLLVIQNTFISNNTEGISIVICMINKMMQELLKVQVLECCKSKHKNKKDKEKEKEKDKDKDKEKDKEKEKEKEKEKDKKEKDKKDKKDKKEKDKKEKDKKEKDKKEKTDKKQNNKCTACGQH